MSDSSQTWCMVPTDPASDYATQGPTAVDESNAEIMTALTNVAIEGEKDETYYWDSVKFLVEGTCFKVPRYQFVIGSTYFAGKLEPTKLSSNEGDEAPITLEGATASQFRVLLKLLFPIHTTSTTLKFSKEEWLVILELSTFWDFHEFRKLAKEHLEPQLDDPIERIVVGRAAYIPRWVLEGYEALITRSECISEQESECIGHLTTVRLYILRHERCLEPRSIASRFRGEIHALEHKERHHMSAEEKRIEEEKRLEAEKQRSKEEEEQRVNEEKRRVKAARRAQKMEERRKVAEAEHAEPEHAEPERWAEAWAETKAEAGAETKAEMKAEDPAETKAEMKAEDGAETKAEMKAEDGAETKAEMKAEDGAETKTEMKAEGPAETKAEMKAEDGAETEAEGAAAEAKGLQKETEQETQEDGQRLQEKEDSKQNQEEKEVVNAPKKESKKHKRERLAKARAEREETERKEKEEERRREEEERLHKEADEQIRKKEGELRMEEARIAQELPDLEKRKEEAMVGRSSRFGVERKPSDRPLTSLLAELWGPPR